jgi:hypothetical protein
LGSSIRAKGRLGESGGREKTELDATVPDRTKSSERPIRTNLTLPAALKFAANATIIHTAHDRPGAKRAATAENHLALRFLQPSPCRLAPGPKMRRGLHRNAPFVSYHNLRTTCFIPPQVPL